MSEVHPPPVPALVVGTVSHTRQVPLRHAFTHRAYQWLVDLDDLRVMPRWLRPLSRFEAVDHLDGGRLGGGIRGDLERFLARREVHLNSGDRVLMLANARVFGHVFNPLSVLWCLSPAGEVRAVVLEVHNTYGERHAYLLDVDAGGRARIEKSFYVSPFNDVAGTYQIRLRLDPDLVSVTVALERDGARILTAITRGQPRPAVPRTLLRVAGMHMFMTQRVSALIRLHGAWLWLRRLPVQSRPRHSKEAVR